MPLRGKTSVRRRVGCRAARLRARRRFHVASPASPFFPPWRLRRAFYLASLGGVVCGVCVEPKLSVSSRPSTRFARSTDQQAAAPAGFVATATTCCSFRRARRTASQRRDSVRVCCTLASPGCDTHAHSVSATSPLELADQSSEAATTRPTPRTGIACFAAYACNRR